MGINVIFIVGAIQQPRVIKRIVSIKNAGYNVKVYGYQRPSYRCNTLPEGIDFTLLGELPDGSGLSMKLKKYRNDISQIVRQHNDGSTLFYCFNLIFSTMVKHYGGRYAYEISDILYAYPKFKYVLPILKWHDRRIVRASEFTVMTSQGFADFLFGDDAPNNLVIQPNKLSTYFSNVERKASLFSTAKIRFAFVGQIRYKETVFRFARIIGEKFHEHEFHFFGDGILGKDAKVLSEKYMNVFFHGAYKNPDDLASIYNQVDVLVSCYETHTQNERIAENNKLYEALFFCKPIIVSENTFLVKRINQYKCGFCIDPYSDDSISSFVESLDPIELSQISSREHDLDKSEAIDDPINLINRIQMLEK